MVDSGRGNPRRGSCIFALSRVLKCGVVGPDRAGRLGDSQTRRVIRIPLRRAQTPIPNF